MPDLADRLYRLEGFWRDAGAPLYEALAPGLDDATITSLADELGLTLPGPFPPHDPLDAVVIHGDRARTSGQLPRNHEGVLVNTGILGSDLTVEQGAEAAHWCALNALSVQLSVTLLNSTLLACRLVGANGTVCDVVALASLE